jgi:hypothetical protein
VDRREFPRVYQPLAFEYQARVHGSDESISSRAFMINMSISGLYFLSETPPILKNDDIADFVFKFAAGRSSDLVPTEIRATGQVKRIEPPNEESPHFGVAVEFLTGPVFIYAE